MEKKYKVLWIDDEPTDSFMDQAYQKDIEIVSQTDYKNGIQWLTDHLYECDAVILDVNCRDNENSSTADAASFTRNFDSVKSLCKDPFIPWFVYTSGENYRGSDALDLILPSPNDWDGKTYYSKPKERLELFENIKHAADSSKNTQIRHKYKDVFNLSDSLSAELIKVIMHLEEQNYTDSGVFNDVRKILDWVMKHMNSIGILPVPFMKTNINECGRFIAELEMQRFIPLYIQRNFASLTYTCNDGSHRSGRTDEDTKSGKAPYLVPAVIYELMSILAWLTSVTISKPEKDFIQKIYKSKPEYRKVAAIGIIEEDPNNRTIHVNDVALPQTARLDLNKKARIETAIRNKITPINEIYTRYSKEWTVIDE